ncbi:hypothetical protein KUTeg_002617 [Tegillarca granosa]|uniref:G-protein coupled receptors family 3 profile domain-containing protein n=1 Tax=Tegillarca granosa TaxID=220873 RepID=A0ABQ9FZ88_TEGGR|nr:hypothetical protein KUTeg_002617 [Tegillarca granosa]
MSDIPRKLNQLRYGYISKKQTEPPKKSTELPIISHEKIDLFSKETSKALKYIENINENEQLRVQECARLRTALTLNDFKLKFSKKSFLEIYSAPARKAVYIANGLTSLLFTHNRYWDLKHLNDTQIVVFSAILKYTVEHDSSIAGGGIAFDNGFFPYIKKTTSGVKKPTDLGIDFNYTDAEFYSIHETKNYSSFWKSNHFTSMVGTNSNNNSTSYVADTDVRGKPEFRGVVMIDIDLNKTDINQCAQDNSLFSHSDKCQPETTQCTPLSGGGLKRGNYHCECQQGYYFPLTNASNKYYTGITLENVYLDYLYNKTNFSASSFQCSPCSQGCDECEDDSPCMAKFNILLRGIPLGIQSFCITVTLVIGIAVLRLRKSKVMVSGMWILLEVILLGAIFLYATVIIQYFEATTTICLIIPWFRELGFAIVYGSLILKMYRLLAEFQSRKAHRVHVRDKDLMKYLCCVIIVVLGYMSAWTTVTLDHISEGKTILEIGVTSTDNLKYYVCKSGWWEYVIEIGTYVSAAICYEAVLSTIFYILSVIYNLFYRHIYWLDLHPDYLFLMYFVRCQMTVTVTLLLIFGPKLLYAHRPPDDQSHIRNRAYSSSEPDNMAPETMKLNIGVSSNGDVDVGELSLADMEIEDIRLELKRLYTQLQIYKTRTMRKDNPHISKRRGGRKQTHRRFSLSQAFHHKHRHHHEHDHEHEMSKTPEESTNSAEAVTMAFETAANKCDDIHDKDNKSSGQCTVTFKMGLKIVGNNLEIKKQNLTPSLTINTCTIRETTCIKLFFISGIMSYLRFNDFMSSET